MDTTPVDSLNPIRSNKLRPTKIFDDDREIRWGNKFHPGGEFAGGGVGDAEAARIAGVNGVPIFVTNGQPAFSGARGPEHFFQAIMNATQNGEKCGPDSCST